MKIFSALFICLTLCATNANAAATKDTTREPEECFEENSGYYNETTGQGIVADYMIRFDNNVSNRFPTLNGVNCEEKIKAAFNERFSDLTDIETVLILGSADNTGDSAKNDKLSAERADKVTKLLNEIGVPMTCTKPDGKCANISIGAAIQRALNRKESTTKTRGVYVFIIKKDSVCTASKANTLEDLLNQVKKSPDLTDLQNRIQEAQQLCNKDQINNPLLRSQQTELDDIISEALKAGLKLGSDIAISALVNSIVSTRDSLAKTASSWKTASGNFNGARLASDSIAGIVLGTAGGLITSNVVKKNQISSGFENIMCTVGGQSVASYGDEFTVGIR